MVIKIANNIRNSIILTSIHENPANHTKETAQGCGSVCLAIIRSFGFAE
jgi:hypothetical protein